jgi:hypothetical protein
MLNNNNNLSRRVEIATNISIILVALVGAAVLVKTYLLRPNTAEITQAAPAVPQGPQNTSSLAANNSGTKHAPIEGTQVSLPGVNWSESNENVVLALSNKCHFCTESAPFYQRLTGELAQRKGVRVIAVFPQEVDQAKQYLSGLGIQIENVKRASLDSIGVSGTPTLMIVDGNGKIKQAWMGRLTSEREAEVLNRVKA